LKDLTPARQSELGLDEAQTAIHKDATRIFRTFFEDGAPHWTCVDDHVVLSLRQKLKEGTPLDYAFFSEAQHQIFLTMQNDMFPRFIKAVLADPEKYSTGDRLEIDAETREHLDKIFEGNSESGVNSPRVRSLKHDAERTLGSPKFSQRRMGGLATVPESEGAA